MGKRNRAPQCAVAAAVGIAGLCVGGCSDSGGSGAEIDPALIEKLPTLKRVARAMGEPVIEKSARAEKVAKTAEWIRTNRYSFNEREVRFLSNMVGFMGSPGDLPGSIADAQRVTDLDYMMLWLLDRDGDLALDDAEARAMLGIIEEVGPVLVEIDPDEWDSDGDGEISPAHAQALAEANSGAWNGLLDQIVERVQLARWDLDRDGVLTEEEIGIVEKSVGYPDLDRNGEISDEEREVGKPLVIDDLLKRLLLIKAPTPESLERAMGRELVNARGDMEKATRAIMTRLMQMRFESIAGDVDADGDGELTETEWATGFDELRQRRDLRVFVYLYDSDQSGGISDLEVARFMDAYDKGSIHADADLSGTVDQQDLHRFVTLIGAM